MIIGVVNAQTEATIRLPVRAADEREQEIEAILDTGFNGSLTLPPAVITSLGLRWRTHGLVMLANGTEDHCDIYAATVIWDGRPRNILVEAADTDPLVGMALLYGHDLHMQVIEGAVSSSNHCCKQCRDGPAEHCSGADGPPDMLFSRAKRAYRWAAAHHGRSASRSKAEHACKLIREKKESSAETRYLRSLIILSNVWRGGRPATPATM